MSYKVIPKFLLLSTSLTLAFSLICLSRTYAPAEDKYWIGGMGSWFDDASWDPYGVPRPWVDNAFLTSSDEIDRTVYYDHDTFAECTILIDAIGTGAMTLHVTEGCAGSYGMLQVGDKGTGTLIITGGSAGGRTQVGTNGTVELYEGSFMGLGMEALSLRGTVSQMGGTSLWDGMRVQFGGQYNISGGELSSIGFGFAGIVNQSGGDISGGGLGVSGTYNMSGGTLFSGAFSIDSTGIFNQTGGINRAGLPGNAGTYNLSGGTLEFTDAGSPFFQWGDIRLLWRLPGSGRQYIHQQRDCKSEWRWYPYVKRECGKQRYLEDYPHHRRIYWDFHQQRGLYQRPRRAVLQS